MFGIFKNTSFSCPKYHLVCEIIVLFAIRRSTRSRSSWSANLSLFSNNALNLQEKASRALRVSWSDSLAFRFGIPASLTGNIPL